MSFLPDGTPVICCECCGRTHRLETFLDEDGEQYAKLDSLAGWIGVPWECPECQRAKAVAAALIGEDGGG